MSVKKTKKKPYFPRVVPGISTASKTIKSKRDKANTRQRLNKKAREDAQDLEN